MTDKKLRLFVLTDNSSGRPVPDLYFHDKPSAKRKRDELGGKSTLRYSVSPGPDHRRYRSN